MAKTLLLIDDDVELSTTLKEYLSRFEFNVITENNPLQAMRHIKTVAIDLVLLDVMMPDKSGIELCKEIRNQSDVPIIMLTARADIADKVVGFEIGADDYVGKPFEPRELVARIQAILRRPRYIEKRRTLRFTGLEINLKDRKVLVDGKTVEFTTAEFEILALLASKPGEVFSRDDILDHLKGNDCDVFQRTVDVLLSRVRAKLRDRAQKPKFIKTIWRTGYAFVGTAHD